MQLDRGCPPKRRFVVATGGASLIRASLIRASLIRAGLIRASLIGIAGLVLPFAAPTLGGCSAAREDPTNGGAGAGGSDADAGRPVELAFEDPREEVLLMGPGTRRTLSVKAKPVGSYVVRFALLPSTNEGDDTLTGAELSTNTADTDPAGVASVELAAPESPTTFTVRASTAGDATARLTVKVGEPGTRKVLVHPSYAGTRTPALWVASAHLDSSCATLDDFTTDGALHGSAPFSKEPEIDGVPVSEAVAITLRGDYLVSGCLDAEITPTDLTSLTVSVRDLPLAIAGTFDVGLGIVSSNAVFGARLEQSQEAAMLRFRAGSGNDDVRALLNAMEDAAGSEGALFAQARDAERWDAAVAAKFGATASEMLTNRIEEWLVAGSKALSTPGALRGALRDRHLVLFSALGIAADEAGFSPAEETATFEALPGDQLMLDAALSWHFGSLVTALAGNPARASVSGAKDVPGALSEVLSCDQLARTLAGADSPDDDTLYAGCAVQPCGVTLCRSALDALWRKARDPSAEDPELMRISATATPTELAGHAVPVRFEGEWTGQIPRSGTPLAVSGAWTGER